MWHLIYELSTTSTHSSPYQPATLKPLGMVCKLLSTKYQDLDKIYLGKESLGFPLARDTIPRDFKPQKVSSHYPIISHTNWHFPSKKSEEEEREKREKELERSREFKPKILWRNPKKPSVSCESKGGICSKFSPSLSHLAECLGVEKIQEKKFRVLARSKGWMKVWSRAKKNHPFCELVLKEIHGFYFKVRFLGIFFSLPRLVRGGS